MTNIYSLVALSPSEFWIICAITFCAGVVRGFSGFALSAVVMAAAALIIPPVQLIPMLLFLELAASLLMARDGIKNADHTVAWGLAIGSAVALPFGLMLTMSLPQDTSRFLALCLVIVLAFTQLMKIRLAFLATKPGLYGTGLLAGIATGIASIGGMVVALYVLARDMAPTRMRASLVMFLFISSFFSFATHILIGTLDWTAFMRGLIFSVPSTIGVVAGKALFIPAWEKYYKPFCLCLLIALAVVGVARLAMG